MMASSPEGEQYVSRVTIDALPDEVMLKILSYSTFSELINVTQNVSRRWKTLSNDPEVWRDKELCVDHLDTDDEVESILEQACQLRHFIMLRTVKPSIIRALCANCHQLTTLHIDSIQKLYDDELEELVKNCPNIRSLTIPCRLINDEHKSLILSGLQLLQSLEIENEYRAEPAAHLAPFADRCPQLDVLKLIEDVVISFEDLEYFINVKCKTLTAIALPRFIYSHRNARCIDPLLEMCTSLTHLDLNCCSLIDSKELTGCSLFVNITLTKLSVLAQLTNIRSLTLRHCPSELAESVFRYGSLSHIEVLEMFDYDLLDNVVVTICMCCPELKELRLNACFEITDEALRELRQLRKLHTLNINECREICGEGIKWVAQVTTLRKLYLENMHLRNWLPYLEENILAMTSLEVLSLNFLDYVFPFDKIPGSLFNLRVLKVVACNDDIEGELQKLKKMMPILKVDLDNLLL